MTITTAEEAQKLLDGTTPGPWRYRPHKHDDWGVVRGGSFKEEWGGYPHLAQVRDPDKLDNDTLNQHRVSGQDPWEANARLTASAPDLARSLLAAHDEIERLRADAQAAVALAFNGAADEIKLRRHLLANVQNVVIPKPEELAIYDICEEAVRDLAPTDGLALVAKLRDRADEYLNCWQETEHELEDTKEERDRLTARLAAQVEALMGAGEALADGAQGMVALLDTMMKEPGRDLSGSEADTVDRIANAIPRFRAALEYATLVAMTPAERADFDLTMRIRGAAGDIAKAQIAAREDGEGRR